jgi:hypothetical protein
VDQAGAVPKLVARLMGHWKGGHTRLPRGVAEAETLCRKRYERMRRIAKTRGVEGIGAGGLTVFAEPLPVYAVARGYDEFGNPTLFLIVEEKDAE